MKAVIALAPFLFLALGVEGQTGKSNYSPGLKHLADSFPFLKNQIQDLMEMEDSLEDEVSDAVSQYDDKYGFSQAYESREWKAFEQLTNQKDSVWENEKRAYFRISDLFDSLSTAQYNSRQIQELIGPPDIRFEIDSAGNVMGSKPREHDDSIRYLDRYEHFFLESSFVGHMRPGQDDEILARLQKIDDKEKRKEFYYYYDIPGGQFQYFMLVFTNDIAYRALLYRHLD